MSPLTVNLLFPDGAPRLNQIALLVITVKANYMDATNMIVRVNLPEALELVSGELSWNGSVIKGDQVDVIKATVKSVKTGNWQIGIYKYVNPDENGFGADGEVPFYISISEDSAQWGKTPPWYKGGNEIPIQPSK